MNRADLLFDLITAQRQLAEASDSPTLDTVSVQSPTPSDRRHRPIADRLTEGEIQALVMAFLGGTPKWKLAERYGIGMTSVKRLLKERGATRQHR